MSDVIITYEVLKESEQLNELRRFLQVGYKVVNLKSVSENVSICGKGESVYSEKVIGRIFNTVVLRK